jgi:hypothetical protein
MALFEQILMQSPADFALGLIALIVGLLILWIVVSIPVWLAAKVLTLGRARFTRAMLVTAVGPAIYAVVFFISAFVLSVTLGQQIFVAVLSFILAFIAWIGVFKMGFETGWLRALGIAVLATVVFIVIGTIVTLALQALVPSAPPITPFPSF